MTREWILSVLELLPVWRWPLFLWDVVRVQLWADELAIHVSGYVSLVVTREGRIVVLNIFETDRPDPADWTQFVPRTPWIVLDLDTLSMAHATDIGDRVRETFAPLEGRVRGWPVQPVTGPG